MATVEPCINKPSDTLVVSAGQSSVAGRKAVNEDSCGIRIPDDYLIDTKGVSAIIADGVSKSSNGREASEACVTGFLHDYYSTPESWSTKTSVQKVLGALNRWLYGRSIRQHNNEFEFVTTLSALIVKSASAYIFHVGDTRIYRWRNNTLEQLTRDHCMVSHGEKTFLSRAMGMEVRLEMDCLSETLEPEDLFLLSTDGVHDHVDERVLAATIRDHRGSLEELAGKITGLAYDSGSEDNLTCQLIRVEAVPFHENEEAFYRRLTELPFPPPLSAGHVLDGFRIIRELHASRRTQVYLAEDVDTGDKVAIKTPSVNYNDDAGYIDRFLHEEWVGRRIDNPHVLRVLAHPRKRRFLYYLTEYCEGLTLRQWMRDHPQPDLSQVRDLMEQIMRGLLAFHRLEMVHRDIKPENILIDRDGTVKVADFGSTRIAGIEEIARPAGGQDDAVGTVNYSAPELLDGAAGDVQSDIYSVGAIAYEMLTGRLPYGENPTPRRLRRIDYTPARVHNQDLPVWVDGALRKAVHKQPRQRYTVLSEFIGDLSNPNSEFTREYAEPLIERNPVRFWQLLFAVSMLGNIILLYLLAG